MNEVIGYIRDYIQGANKKIVAICTLQTALLVFLNYHNELEARLANSGSLPWPAFTGHFMIFFFAFSLPYVYSALIERKGFFIARSFNSLLVAAPAIFAMKVALRTILPVSSDPAWNEYWNQVYYWPARLLIIVSILFLVWRRFDSDQPFYGVATGKFRWKPYLLMLLFMLPLIAAASTQNDFLATYPKINSILQRELSIHLSWLHKLLFEISYGTDFFGIELFFRGFLVLAFMKWAGRDAVLPMACFYCTIHFGKPLGECISSYFGGILLGIVVYNTRSIFGGLVVHLGIAWLMEVGGYIGHAVSLK